MSIQIKIIEQSLVVTVNEEEWWLEKDKEITHWHPEGFTGYFNVILYGNFKKKGGSFTPTYKPKCSGCNVYVPKAVLFYHKMVNGL